MNSEESKETGNAEKSCTDRTDGYNSAKRHIQPECYAHYFSLLFFSFIIFNSCSPKREEYRANIRVTNNSSSTVKNFTLKTDAENKIIETLELNEECEFQVKWIGRSSSFLSSIDNSYIFLEITYAIDNRIFDVTNEKGVLIDSYGDYYSEKTITDGSKINVKIDNNGYEIIDER